VLTGLRGVGKTVLLNALRSAAVRAGMGHRQARGAARPVAASARWPRPLHQAVRELGHPAGRAWDHVLGVAQVVRPARARRRGHRPGGAKLRDRWNPGITVPAVTGRADSGDIEIDLVELLSDIGGMAADTGSGHRDLHRRDAGPQRRRRLGVVRGLPRDVAVAAARGRRRGRAAAPAGGAVGLEVLLGAAFPLLADRPPRRGVGADSRWRRRPRRRARPGARRRWRRCMP
jgi:hypothetical protein